LGAAGLGDIGTFFPDSDPTFADADSMELLADVVRRVLGAGWVIGNVDCTVVCERPKIAPHRAEMERRLATTVGAPVSVKASTAERLGAIGNGDGVVCLAVALLTQ
jgi:2-C-methyl-D-erythritol 2,4-cyclodiphosphate synthase